jgi:hypothetical protein
MVTLHYTCTGEAKLSAFDKVGVAMQFAVRLIQRDGGRISEPGIVGDRGEVLFTSDDLYRLSKQVRLP